MTRKSIEDRNKPVQVDYNTSAGLDLCQPIFQVTFGCEFKGIVAIKLNAPSAEAAEKIAWELVEQAGIVPPDDEGLPYCEAMMGGKCRPNTLDVRAAEDNRGFDLRDVDFGSHLK